MNLTSLIETILFVYGEPMSAEKLAEAAKKSREEVLEALQNLASERKESGIIVLEKDGFYQLGSNPLHTSYVETLVKSGFSEELSRAALDTIAIIAYKGPLTRAEIDYMRGVNSSFTIRNLLMRGLVEQIENPKDARSYHYCVSFGFLQHLGLTSLNELPHYEDINKEAVAIAEEVEKEKSV